MSNSLAIIGAPSSAGAYAPGQEKAPAALRLAGLGKELSAHGVRVDDRGDVSGFRWRADRANPRAMNVDVAAQVAVDTANRVAGALAGEDSVLVLGGDCTIELGTVSGALVDTDSVGLIYVDLDTDLNTPDSTDDGALDWMGVAHMLAIEGAMPALANIGPRTPLLGPDQILFFANGNSKPFERRIIEERQISEVNLEQVSADPAGAAFSVVNAWASRFERLLIHLDVDVLDYLDMPLAENTRRNIGLHFDQLIAALDQLLSAPNWVALTVSEVNPDHAERDGSTLAAFAKALAAAISMSPRLKNNL